MAALFSVGPVLETPMGSQPVTWTELYSFVQMRGEPLTTWEADALISMSRSYLSSREKGKDPLSISPIDREKDNDFPIDETDNSFVVGSVLSSSVH